MVGATRRRAAQPDLANAADARNEISRLSADFEPMHLNDGNTASHVREIDNLGVHVKDIISTVNRLEGLGLQRLKIPLPKIIVLGEQSTGKSSVIEGISGIKTPRSIGTCTRCPLFIKLESPMDPNARWNAHITLRRSFNTVEFLSSKNPDHLEDIILRAQRAVTSPGVDYIEFTKPNIDHLRDRDACNFSPNVVCISISHPGLPALSFYDLPGIIGQSEVPEDVTFVRNLVVEYVKDPEALVLLQIDALARVLTKPDRPPESNCRDMLLDIFEAKRLPLGLGYFVVRNLGQDQLARRVTHKAAREQERQFFADSETFNDLQKHQSRFGTWNLQSFLSGKLAEQITKKLPIIEEDLQARLNEIQTELKLYPEPPTQNASRIISDLIFEFSLQVRLAVDGESNDYSFTTLEGKLKSHAWYNKWKAIKKSLGSSLLTLKPTLTTTGSRDKGLYRASLSGGASASDSIVLESDEEMGEDTDEVTRTSKTPESPTKKRKGEPSKTPESPTKKHRGEPLDALPARTRVKEALMPEIPTPDFADKRTKFRLDEVGQYLDEVSHSSVPGYIDPRVTEQMALQTLQEWQLPVTEFFNILDEHLRSQLREMFDEVFRKWTGMALYNAAWKIVEQMVNLNLHQQRTTMAMESLEDETNSMYISQGDKFIADKEAQLELYRQARYTARLALYKKERIRSTGGAIMPAEEARIFKNQKLMDLLHEEPYQTELGVVACVTVYYLTAMQRFFDSLCMRIESKFFKQLRTQLRDELENGLDIHDEVKGYRNAVRLLAEDPQRETQRQVLLAKESSLRQGQQILQDLKKKTYGEEVTSRPLHTGEGSGMVTPQSDEMDEV
ncbi:hypothetical protein ACEQ8H_007608 [Pleosporales sp. CAS-2024a]